jgi:hypothetical protein
MDIWEQGAKLGSNNNESNKMYGKEHWDKFIETHEYFFVEFNQAIKSNMIPMGHFAHPDATKYKIYCNRFGYSKNFSKYNKTCLKINAVLKDFNYTFFKIRHNPIFKAKEFGQFCILIKELYQYGSFNYPSWRVDNDYTVNSHPGQHLNFARIYLGLPLHGFISVPKTNTARLNFIKENSQIIRYIKADTEIIEILGTNKIAACMQTYSGQLVPSLYPSIPRPIWSDYDTNGNTDWPWGEAANFYNYLERTNYVSIIDEVVYSNEPIKIIEQHAIIHNTFSNTTQLVNNFMAFLLTEQHKDLNFELICRQVQ